jgi:hypothetical protein
MLNSSRVESPVGEMRDIMCQEKEWSVSESERDNMPWESLRLYSSLREDWEAGTFLEQ